MNTAMARFESLESGEGQDAEAQRSPLHDEYVQTRSDMGGQEKSGQKLRIEDGDEEQGDAKEDPSEERKALSTGDTYVTSESGDVLLMPDGGKIGFSLLGEVGDFGTLAELPERLRFVDRDGKEGSVRYAGTKTSVPPIDVYNMSDGSQISVQAGIGVIKMVDGTQIYMDELGFFGVVRGDKQELIRQPDVIGNPYEELTVPRNEKREL